jgi:hypothetical protein
MTIQDAAKAIEAEIVAGTERDGLDINSACGADLMSDVMAFVKDRYLLTGLINIQVIRTAVLMDIEAVCFCSQAPTERWPRCARERIGYSRPVSRSSLACCRLYEAGVREGGAGHRVTADALPLRVPGDDFAPPGTASAEMKRYSRSAYRTRLKPRRSPSTGEINRSPRRRGEADNDLGDTKSPS